MTFWKKSKWLLPDSKIGIDGSKFKIDNHRRRDLSATFGLAMVAQHGTTADD